MLHKKGITGFDSGIVEQKTVGLSLVCSQEKNVKL